MSGQTEIMWGEVAVDSEAFAANEWTEAKLSEFISVKHGFAFKGENITSEQGLNILVTPGNFHIGGGFKSDKFKYYKATDFPESYILNGGDIVVTMTDLSKESDTLGYSAKVPFSTDCKYLHNQRVGLVQFKSKDVEKDFLYWLMRTRDYQSYIASSASGTSIMHTSPGRIVDYTFLLPSLPEQRAIAGVLSSLDDKIDLLHRQNATLEALAETLFRQWFVEQAKEEWEEGVLGDFFTLQRGFDLPTQNRVLGKFPIITSSGYSAGHNEYKIKGPGVTTGRSGVIGKVFYVMEDFWPLNTSLFIKEYKLGTPLFSYFTLKFADLESFNAGSAVPTLNRNHVHAHVAAIPPKELIEAFERIAYPHFEKMHKNTKQIQTLSTLRDTLLPKLMSGEVRVAY